MAIRIELKRGTEVSDVWEIGEDPLLFLVVVFNTNLTISESGNACVLKRYTLQV